MSEHLTDRLHRNSVRKGNGRGERMPGEVESDRQCKGKRTGEDET